MRHLVATNGSRSVIPSGSGPRGARVGGGIFWWETDAKAHTYQQETGRGTKGPIALCGICKCKEAQVRSAEQFRTLLSSVEVLVVSLEANWCRVTEAGLRLRGRNNLAVTAEVHGAGAGRTADQTGSPPNLPDKRKSVEDDSGSSYRPVELGQSRLQQERSSLAYHHLEIWDRRERKGTEGGRK